jgi:hypothetical protein
VRFFVLDLHFGAVGVHWKNQTNQNILSFELREIFDIHRHHVLFFSSLFRFFNH